MSNRHASRTKDLLNPFDHLFVFQQAAITRGGATLFYGVDEMRFVLEEAINRFFDQSCRVLSGASGALANARFLLRREVHFHAQ